VNWERPICSDNSGRWPLVVANRQSGALFDVPGSYHIQYTLNDMADNVYRNCSFRITLKGNTLLITDSSIYFLECCMSEGFKHALCK